MTAINTLERASIATGVPVAVLRGRCARRDLCMIRWAAMAAMRSRGLSLPTIGRIMHRDHGTVHSGLRRAEAMRSVPGFAELIEVLG